MNNYPLIKEFNDWSYNDTDDEKLDDSIESTDLDDDALPQPAKELENVLCNDRVHSRRL